MAKAVAVVSALCFLALASLAHAQEAFTVKGRVYCDPCRVEFQTSLSKSIEGKLIFFNHVLPYQFTD